MAPSERIVTEIEAPEVVFLPAGKTPKSVDLDILCRIHNVGEEDYGLIVEHPDDVHAWHLLDENHREIDRAPVPKRQKGKGDVLTHASQHILGGHSHNVPQKIRLDAAKLKPGKHYYLRYEFWGEVGETEFRVEQLPGAPAKAPPKKSPPKKAAPKKAAAKRTARKAPARRPRGARPSSR